jgi:MFS family permease
MDLLGQPGRTDPNRARPRAGFSFLWFGIAVVVQAVLTAALVVGLPMVVSALDFEGSSGMTVAIPVWFIGGVLLGMIAPSRTYAEPLVASFFVQIPTILYLWRGQTVRTMPLFMYLIMGLIGVLFSLVGAYVGERIQMGPPAKTAE